MDAEKIESIKARAINGGNLTKQEVVELCRLALQAKRGLRLLQKSALLLDTKSPGCPEHWDDKAWPLADEILRHLEDTE